MRAAIEGLAADPDIVWVEAPGRKGQAGSQVAETDLRSTAGRLRRYVLPEPFTRVRSKRLRLAFLNVAARIGRHARRIQLKFSHGYRWVSDFAAAIRQP